MAIVTGMSASNSAAKSVTQSGSQLAPSTDVLGKDDFLKLLVTELQYSDISAAGEGGGSDRQMIAQLAQFSSLEQMSNLNTAVGQLIRLQATNESASLLGRNISAIDPATSEVVTGSVQGIEFVDGQPFAVVGSTRVPLESIYSMS